MEVHCAVNVQGIVHGLLSMNSNGNVLAFHERVLAFSSPGQQINPQTLFKTTRLLAK